MPFVVPAEPVTPPAPTSPPVAPSESAFTSLLVRERAPLRLSVNVQTPAGFRARWGNDDPDPGNAPGALTFSSTMPGGFENCSCVLERDPGRAWPDLEELSTVTVTGAGGQVAWQGRVEQLPATAGDEEQITPTCVGWESHLADDASAREIFVDCDLTNWIGPSLGRQVQLVSAGSTGSGPQVTPDYSNGYPSLSTEVDGAWTQPQYSEGWYDAHGLPIGLLRVAWQTNGEFVLGTGFGAAISLASDDNASSYDQFIIPAGDDTGAATLTPSATRPWAVVGIVFLGSGGADGVTYALYWTSLAVYGAHGLPLQGVASANSAQGLLASDIIAYAVGRWAPKLAYSKGQNGTIQPSSFVIAQSVYLNPTTVSAMIPDAAQYELLDWAVWEGGGLGVSAVPTFYCNPRGARGNAWVARSGPAQLADAGAQVSALWNGVVVSFTDVTGETRTYGPPGSGANMTDVSLADPDPQNPANQTGINRYSPLTLGTSDFPGALKAGQEFLAATGELNTSGSASLVGHVMDSHGVLWPAWMVRAGDSISFIDAADSSPRRVVSSSYTDADKTNAVQLDQPPDTIQAVIERLSESLASFGGS